MQIFKRNHVQRWEGEVEDKYVQLRCSDYLKDNPSLTAHKARRKKMAFVRVSITNHGTADVHVDVAQTSLSAGQDKLGCAKREDVYRRVYEWRWVAFFFMIISLSWVDVAVELGAFFIDSLINRRTRHHLRNVIDDGFVIRTGQEFCGVLAFERVTEGDTMLNIAYRVEDNQELISCELKIER